MKKKLRSFAEEKREKIIKDIVGICVVLVGITTWIASVAVVIYYSMMKLDASGIPFVHSAWSGLLSAIVVSIIFGIVFRSIFNRLFGQRPRRYQ